MAREKNDDIEFGSDSFLDVVANIVGILIILIVVAGIKAGATPVNAQRVAEYLKKHSAAAASASSHAAPPPPAQVDAPERHVPPPPLIIPQSPELVRQATALKSQLAALDSDDQASATKVRTAGNDEKQVERRIVKVKRAIEEEMAELTEA